MKLPHIRYLNKNTNLSLTNPMRNSGVISATSLRWFCNKKNIQFKLKQSKNLPIFQKIFIKCKVLLKI